MGFRVEPDDVDTLVDLVKSAGVRNVSDEAAELNLPGVLVVTRGYTFNLAKGYTLNAELQLCAGDQNPRRARKALQELLNQVLTVISPSGQVVAGTALLPEHDPARVPALQVPITVTVTP